MGDTNQNKKRRFSPTDENESESTDLPHTNEGTDTQNDGTVTKSNDTWPRYLVMTDAEDNGSLAKLSPFAIAKGIQGLAGEPKMIKKIRQGLLVEVASKVHSDLLLQSTELATLPIKVSPHHTLNSCKGVIFCPDLSNDGEEYILQNLRSQDVSSVKRIHVNRGQKATDRYILTFSRPELPPKVKIGYYMVKVEAYIPNPLRCYKCQAYGHGSSRCTRNERCSKCGENHSHSVCTIPEPKCLHCNGKHETSDRKCPQFLLEKEIVKLKYTENISFFEARKRVTAAKGPTYATVTKSKLTTKSVTIQTDPLDCLPALSLWSPNSSEKTQIVWSKDLSAEQRGCQTVAHKADTDPKTPSNKSTLPKGPPAEHPGSQTIAHTAGAGPKTTTKAANMPKGHSAEQSGGQTIVHKADGPKAKGGGRPSPSPSSKASKDPAYISTEEGMDISSSPPDSQTHGRRRGEHQSNQGRSRSRSVLDRSSVSTVSYIINT